MCLLVLGTGGIVYEVVIIISYILAADVCKDPARVTNAALAIGFIIMEIILVLNYNKVSADIQVKVFIYTPAIPEGSSYFASITQRHWNSLF